MNLENQGSHFSTYRQKDGFLVLFDVTNWQSYFCTTSWFQEIEKHYPDKNVVKLLIGAKSDACEREIDGLKAKVFKIVIIKTNVFIDTK